MKLNYFAEQMLISEIDQEFRLLYDPIEEVREEFYSNQLKTGDRV